jgi:hypothetical protein
MFALSEKEMAETSQKKHAKSRASRLRKPHLNKKLPRSKMVKPNTQWSISNKPFKIAILS